jgi:hypothetical protein
MSQFQFLHVQIGSWTPVTNAVSIARSERYELKLSLVAGTYWPRQYRMSRLLSRRHLRHILVSVLTARYVPRSKFDRAENVYKAQLKVETRQLAPTAIYNNFQQLHLGRSLHTYYVLRILTLIQNFYNRQVRRCSSSIWPLTRQSFCSHVWHLHQRPNSRRHHDWPRKA